MARLAEVTYDTAVVTEWTDAQYTVLFYEVDDHIVMTYMEDGLTHIITADYFWNDLQAVRCKLFLN